MRIKELTTENFKSCPDGNYRLGKVNLLIGGNGRGKTSLQNALRYLLNGKLPDDPIRHGEDHVRVSAVIDDGQDTAIERAMYLPDTYQVNGEGKKEKEFTAEVRRLRAYHEANHIPLSIGGSSNPYFICQPQKEAWDFLQEGRTSGKVAGLKSIEATAYDGTVLYMVRSRPSSVRVSGNTTTAKALGEMLKARTGGDPKALDIVTSSEVLGAMQMSDFAKYLMDIVPIAMDFGMMAKLAGLTADEQEVLRPLFPPAPSPISVSDVKEAYKVVCSVRQEISSRMEALKARSAFEGRLPSISDAAVQEKMGELYRQIVLAAQLKDAWGVYNRRIQEREAAVRNLNAWAAEYNAMGYAEPAGKELNALFSQERALRGRIMDEERSAASLRQSAVPIRKMLEGLDTQVCPLCSDLICRTDKTQARESLAASVRDISRNAEAAEKAAASARAELDTVLKAIDAAREKASLYERKSALYRQIQALKQALPEVPAQPSPMQAQEGLEAEYAKYQEMHRQYVIYDQCRKALEDYNAVRAQYSLYQGLARKCEPRKGLLTNTVLRYLLAPFTDHLNAFAKSIYPDMEMSFRVGDAGLQVYCRPHGRDCFVKVSALSTGERCLAMLALMDMVSSISNVRLLVFDNLESLDAQAFSALLALLMRDDVAGRYDHILLSAVGHEDIQETALQFPGITVIRF